MSAIPTQRLVKTAAALALPLTVAAAAPAASASDRTNLILIMTDDQGAWSLGCYGSPDARTPTLDRLAAQGARFANAFATIPVCSPVRATLYTGRIPSQHGIHDWISNENIGPRARYCTPDEILLSDLLARHGYTCGLSGKWHLGDSLRPHAGYSFWYVLPTGGSHYNDADMVWGGQITKTDGYITDRITDKAVEFLDANRDRPFFLNVEYNAPHGPWKGHPQPLLDLFRDCPFASIPKPAPDPTAVPNRNRIGDIESIRQYFAACTGVDRAVQRILDRLDDLDLSRRTLVIFTSDQGFCLGHHGVWGKGNGTNPRNMFDPSIRIPLIFRQPGRINPETTIDAFVSTYDFLPTILDYLGLPPSPGRNLPGRSFAPMLHGEPVADWPDAVFAEYGHTRMIRTNEWKYVHRADGGPHELYNLMQDPDEANNLAHDPAHRDTLLALRGRLFEWFAKYVEAGADPIGHEYLPPAERPKPRKQPSDRRKQPGRRTRRGVR